MAGETPPPLLAHFAEGILAPALKRRLVRPPYLKMLGYLFAYQRAFETGVLLEYAYREKVSVFVQLLATKGESDFLAFIYELAKKRLRASPEPGSFFDLGMRLEDERIRQNWKNSGETEPQIRILEKYFKVPVDTAWRNIWVALNTGMVSE